MSFDERPHVEEIYLHVAWAGVRSVRPAATMGAFTCFRHPQSPSPSGSNRLTQVARSGAPKACRCHLHPTFVSEASPSRVILGTWAKSHTSTIILLSYLKSLDPGSSDWWSSLRELVILAQNPGIPSPQSSGVRWILSAVLLDPVPGRCGDRVSPRSHPTTAFPALPLVRTPPEYERKGLDKDAPLTTARDLFLRLRDPCERRKTCDC